MLFENQRSGLYPANKQLWLLFVFNFDCIWLAFVSLLMLQQTHLARDYKFEMVPFLQESHYYRPSHCCPNYNNIAGLYNLTQQHSHCFFFTLCI